MRKFLLPGLLGLFAIVWATLGLTADKSTEQAVRERIAKQFPEAQISDVRATPMAGIYEVSIGGEIGYVTTDGKYLLHGDLIELGTQKNLTEERRGIYRKKLLADIGEKNMIIFRPKKVKHTVTVFTDIDCGYCRKLHQQIKGYEDEGIAVRYLFFPRAGLNSESARKADAVWCAKDRREALTRAKQGETLAAATCKTPVARHFQAGVDLGVRGTPAIIADDGRLIAGYMPPAELLKELEHPSR